MNENILKFLGQVYINFKRSELAYKQYREDGSKFIYAKILKQCNENIRDLLIQNSFMLSERLLENAIELVFHYDIWIEKWNQLEGELMPSLEDKFIFQNSTTFPRAAAQNLENEFLNIIRKK